MGTHLSKLSVDYRPASVLISYVCNARTHSDVQDAQITASIREFGFTIPILMDGENCIIAGQATNASAVATVLYRPKSTN